MNNMILRAENIHKTYKVGTKRLEVLRDVNVTFERGGLYFILGRSGSGKSTLLNVIGGLDKPNKGTVYVEDMKLYGLNERTQAHIRNEKIGFVFQFYHLLPELTVWENVMLPGQIARRIVKKRADELLDIVGLQERKKHLPSQLSGGEMQRAALARALVNDPDIVFCDEPTGNLDEDNATIIYDLIDRLHKEKRQTFCVVTHEESFVHNHAQVFRLRNGELHKA